MHVCVFCTLSSVQSVNMYCPYVNCCFFFLHCLSICKLLLFFCTVWSTVNAPVQFFLHCLSIGKLFVVFLHCLSIGKLSVVFLHCLSIGKLSVVFFALSGARSQEFHSPRHLCCGDVTIKVI